MLRVKIWSCLNVNNRIHRCCIVQSRDTVLNDLNDLNDYDCSGKSINLLERTAERKFKPAYLLRLSNKRR